MAIAIDTRESLKEGKGYYFNLIQKFATKSAKVGIIGMGYVGLPNMVSKASEGFDVLGFDVDLEKISSVNKGTSYIEDVSSVELKSFIENKKIEATDDFSRLSECDVIVICVPTPIDAHKQPLMTYVIEATSWVYKYAEKGSLVILESTTYPTTTEDYIVTPLELKGFTVGQDVFVAYAPERIDPSNKQFNVENTPRVVGGHTEMCTDVASEFLGSNPTRVSSTKVAEMSKILENTFRFVNIALANEMAVICDKMGIDVWEVIDASATKPYGFMPFYPTTKIGGHCIPVDPHYLSWFSKKYDYNSQMIGTADEVNSHMINFTIQKIIKVLNVKGITLNGSNITILGVSYKKDIGDTRESGVYSLYKELKEYGANINMVDPHVEEIRVDGDILPVHDVDYQKIAMSDVCILMTDHTDFNYERIAKTSSTIFDTKNGFKGVDDFVGEYYKL